MRKKCYFAEHTRHIAFQRHSRIRVNNSVIAQELLLMGGSSFIIVLSMFTLGGTHLWFFRATILGHHDFVV